MLLKVTRAHERDGSKIKLNGMLVDMYPLDKRYQFLINTFDIDSIFDVSDPNYIDAQTCITMKDKKVFYVTETMDEIYWQQFLSVDAFNKRVNLMENLVSEEK
ncbi:hypothetical protein M0R19_08870 [Candidatus Pacearchaeota archaeon]|jgi:6-pyruvoyl-tetrahydropterin synthase|nr:hypothetical protein [Candidatus Pacearchaeota archaeon]